MADHFFGILPGNVGSAESDTSLIKVGTATAGATYIELRVPDTIQGQAGIVGDSAREVMLLAAEAISEYLRNHDLPLGG